MRPRDFGLVALAGVLWGTGGLAGASLSDAGIAPGAVASYRLLFGGLLLVVVLAAAGRLARVPRTRPVVARVVVTAVLAAVFEAAYFEAVARAGVAVATLVTLGAAPVLVALVGAVRSRRLPSPATLLALGLALAGLVALVGAGQVAPVGDEGTLGIVLALVAAAVFAGMTGVNGTEVSGLDGVTTTALAFTLGGILLLPYGAGAGGLELPQDAPTWAVLVFLAAIPTAAAWCAYFTGLRTVPATTATLLALLEPLTAAVGAAWLRDERLGVPGVVGAMLLVAAIAVLRPRRAASPTMDGPGRAAGHSSRLDAVRARGETTSGVTRVSDRREGPASG